MTRRDQCYFVGKRAATLTLPQAAWAWHELAIGLENDLSQMDIPKFRHLLHRIRLITISAKQASGIPLDFNATPRAEGAVANTPVL